VNPRRRAPAAILNPPSQEEIHGEARLRDADEAFLALQNLLMNRPDAGDLIPDAGGLRKLRFGDGRRGKGKRGGLRVIYYWWIHGFEFWLFTLYDKDEMSDLTKEQLKVLKTMIKVELQARKSV
jgi:hypothetical protein